MAVDLSTWPVEARELEGAARSLHDFLHLQVSGYDMPPEEGLVQLVADESVSVELSERLQRLNLALRAVA